MTAVFEDFYKNVPEEHKSFVSSLHKQLTKQGCTVNIKEAKHGYTASYLLNRKTIMKWVFQKSGITARIYGDNLKQYEKVITALPVNMHAKMKKSRDCRCLSSSGCNATSIKGLIFELDNNTYMKCRYHGMFFLLTEQSGQYIEKLVTEELKARQ